MHPAEIAEVAISNGLVRSTAPASVNAAIWKEIRDSQTPRFEKTSGGYRLANGATARLRAPVTDGGRDISELERVLKKRLTEIRRFLRGDTVGIDANTMCIWLEFCSLLELYDEVVQLFGRISEEAADPFLYGRARRLVRVSKMKVES